MTLRNDRSTVRASLYNIARTIIGASIFLVAFSTAGTSQAKSEAGVNAGKGASNAGSNVAPAICAVSVPNISDKRQEDICKSQIMLLEASKKQFALSRLRSRAELRDLEAFIRHDKSILRSLRIQLGEPVGPDTDPMPQQIHG